MTIALIVALLLGGTSYAAEKSLPGDALYPVKVSVNEKVVDLLAVGAKVDAKWQAKLAERRLEEAEKLASEGKLSVDEKKKLEANFEEHASRVEKHTDDFKAKSDTASQADISSNFEVSLRAHEAILQKLGVDNADTGDLISSLRAKVTERAGKAEEDRADSEKKISEEKGPNVQAAAEGKMKAAENKITEVRKFIDSMKEKLGTDAVSKAEVSISDAVSLIAAGKAKIDAKDYGAAFEDFQKAEQRAQESKLLIQASDDLKIKLDIESSLRAGDDENDDSVKQEIEKDENEHRGGDDKPSDTKHE